MARRHSHVPTPWWERPIWRIVLYAAFAAALILWIMPFFGNNVTLEGNLWTIVQNNGVCITILMVAAISWFWSPIKAWRLMRKHRIVSWLMMLAVLFLLILPDLGYRMVFEGTVQEFFAKHAALVFGLIAFTVCWFVKNLRSHWLKWLIFFIIGMIAFMAVNSTYNPYWTQQENAYQMSENDTLTPTPTPTPALTPTPAPDASNGMATDLSSVDPSTWTDITDVSATRLTGVIQGYQIPLREGASANTTKLDSLDTGEEVTVLREEGNWFYVRTEANTYGYVQKSFVNRHHEGWIVFAENTPVYRLPMYANYTEEGCLLGKRPAGECYQILGKFTNEYGEWYQIYCAPGVGFVKASGKHYTTAQLQSYLSCPRETVTLHADADVYLVRGGAKIGKIEAGVQVQMVQGQTQNGYAMILILLDKDNSVECVAFIQEDTITPPQNDEPAANG